MSENIPKEFTEEFGGGTGIRFKIRNVQIEGKGNEFHSPKGGLFNVTMELLHNCTECDNAVNQVIVGLGGEKKAQVCVWNGKNFSGGELCVVNYDTDVACYGEDNFEAEWVKVSFKITVPDAKGKYYIRARYAQDYVGTILTESARGKNQPFPKKALGWWTVDRPAGPDEKSNIGLIAVG